MQIRHINNILKNYNIGPATKIKRITSGYANLNYRITTHKGNFLFRICKEKPIKEVQYEIKLLTRLKKIKFPTAFPIQRKDKEYISITKHGGVVIYNFVEGKEPRINIQTTRQIARAVAKLNSIKNWKHQQKKNAISISLCNSLIRKFPKSKNKYPQLFDYFKEQTDFLSKPLNQEVPKGLVHGDIFPDNTIFKGNKLQAVLDFEEACTDNLLFDLGVTINGFCFKNNKLDPILLNNFLKEYNNVRKISKKEKQLLPYYIQWGAHAMVCWHLKHLLNKRYNRQLRRTTYLMNRVKALRKEIPIQSS